MKPPPFTYLRPTSVEETLAALAEYGEACKLLAGGQSLVPLMNLRMAAPQRLIDINRLSTLDYVRREDGELVIGALTRHTTLRESRLVAELCPLMTAAYQHVAHQPVRNRGTLGGNLSHAYPASEMPAVALALDATLLARRHGGARTITAAEFFRGSMETALEPTELLTEIRIPAAPRGQGWSFQEVSTRKGDFALAGAGCLLELRDGLCAAARLVFCAVADRPVRIAEAEQVLLGHVVDDALCRAAGEIAGRQVDPESDFHADAEYRRDLVRTLTRRTLSEAHARCV